MSSHEIKSVLGTNEAGNKVFIGIYEKNIQYYSDTATATITISVYEDAKAGRQFIDSLRVRLEPDYLTGSMGLTTDQLSGDIDAMKPMIIDAVIAILKATYKQNRGTFPKKEIVWSERAK